MSILEIKWKNHNGLQVSAFYQMLLADKLCDCVLSTEGQSLKVHKIVLAAASPYFLNLFTLEGTQMNQNSFIVLNEMTFAEMNDIVEFIYTGTVDIASANVSRFIALAKSLKLTGIDDFAVDCKDKAEEKSPSPTTRKRCHSANDSLVIFTSEKSVTSKKVTSKEVSHIPRAQVGAKSSQAASSALPRGPQTSPRSSFLIIAGETPPSSTRKRRSKSASRTDELDMFTELKAYRCKFCPCQYANVGVRNEHQKSCWFNPNRPAKKVVMTPQPAQISKRRATFVKF